MTFDLEKMRRNRDAGTNGPFHYDETMKAVYAGSDDIVVVYDGGLQFPRADGPRIAMAPDMEAEIERLTAERDALAEALSELTARINAVNACAYSPNSFTPQPALAKLEKNDD